uniref:Uncharacterized protein n=1 Tax=Klebsiella pneumoniae TaxID=573 RepID=A0A2P1BPF6_KLEPN|nr:hypothetical protein [Klebsiella pneumoniae]
MRDSARSCSPLTSGRNYQERRVIADQLRFTDTPVRRWFDRRVLREMVRRARASELRSAARHQGRDPPLSACRHRRCGAIRMSPCRLRVHRPVSGPFVNTTLCYRRAVCWLCRAFTLARQPQGWSSLAPPSPDKAVAGLPLPPARFTRPHPSGLALFRVCRVATSASALPVVEKGERNPVFNLLHRDGLCRAFTLARPLQMQVR